MKIKLLNDHADMLKRSVTSYIPYHEEDMLMKGRCGCTMFIRVCWKNLKGNTMYSIPAFLSPNAVISSLSKIMSHFYDRLI